MTIKNYNFRTSLATGLVIGAMALLGAERYPLFFALIGAGWLATVVVGYVLAQRRADA